MRDENPSYEKEGRLPLSTDPPLLFAELLGRKMNRFNMLYIPIGSITRYIDKL